MIGGLIFKKVLGSLLCLLLVLQTGAAAFAQEDAREDRPRATGAAVGIPSEEEAADLQEESAGFAGSEAETAAPDEAERLVDKLGRIEDTGQGLVFGADNRVWLDHEARTTYPYRAVVGLIVYMPNGDILTGTGTMISSNKVLTCGHCVYDPRVGWADSVEVIPGRSQDDWPYGSCWATNYVICSAWYESVEGNTREDYYNTSDYGYDLAVLTLDTPIGDTVGWAGMNWTTYSMDGQWVEAVGIPGSNLRMGSATGQIWEETSESFSTQIDLEPGQSGAPLLVDFGNGDYRIVGVHCSEVPEEGVNKAVRLTEDKYNWILQEINN